MKSVFITGLSGDLGHEIARTFAPDWEVWGTRHQEQIESSPVHLVDCDLQNRESIEAALQSWSSQVDDPAVVIHAAGSPSQGLLHHYTEEEFDQLLSSHLRSSVWLAQATGKIFFPRKAGHLIFISSLAGLRPRVGQSLYSMVKGGMNSLTRSLAKEWALKQIRVNAIAPGFIESKIINQQTDQVRTEMINQIPLRRFGEASEVGQLARYLASDSSSYLTGQVIHLDGGASIS
ncbi:MAG: SDR family NAD(P)-dependent oxidoreductase [Verrucomicrobiota bacterium]